MPINWESNGKFVFISGDAVPIYDSNNKLVSVDFGADVEYMDGKMLRYQTGSSHFFFLFGFNFIFNSVLYGISNHNIARCVARHFKKKIPEGHEIELCAKLGIDDFDHYLANSRWVDDNMSDYAAWVQSHVEHNYEFSVEEGAKLLSLETHKKQKLRIKAYEEADVQGSFVRSLINPQIEWKIKILEDAKAGRPDSANAYKPPRVIVDMSVPNSLVTVHYANSWKTATSGVLFTAGRWSCMYVGAVTPEALSYSIETLLRPDLPNILVFSSDDAMIKMEGSEVFYNIDISSNDSSHTISTFKSFARCSNMSSELYDCMIAQVKSDFTIYNSSKTKKCKIRPMGGYLPSGIGYTTTCNNNIYMLMCYKLGTSNVEPTLMNFFQSGLEMGFRFTAQAVNYSSLQFLKNSPVRRGDVHIMVPNLGMLLKYSGRIKGTLPPIEYPRYVDETNIESKLLFFQTLLTFGFFTRFMYKPWLVLCPFFNELNSNRKLYYDNLKFIDSNDSLLMSSDVAIELSRDEAYSRYMDLGLLTDTDIDEFEMLLTDIGLGKVIDCQLVQQVLSADYDFRELPELDNDTLHKLYL